MPKWWPWKRSADSVAAQAAVPPPAATPPTPSWQRLAPMQRTVGLESTAQFAGFTESLTTSQNPGFTRPVQLLAAENTDGLPVLELARSAVNTPNAPTPAQSAPRTWAPRLPSVQRARVGTVAAVQRAADDVAATDEPAAHVYPVDATDVAHAEPKTMVEATDPDDRRTLGVADEPAVPAGPQPEPPAVSAPDATPSVPSARVQRTPSDGAVSSPVVQPLPVTHPRTAAAPPLRTLSSVQRLTTRSPLPVLRTLTSPEPNPPVTATRPAVTAPEDVSIGVSGDPPDSTPTIRDVAAIQRTPIPDAVENAPAEPATPAPSPPPVVSIDAGPPAKPAAEHSALPVTAATPAPDPTSAPPPVAVHRIAAAPDEPRSTTTSGGASPRAAQPSSVPVQRLPVVQTRPMSRKEPTAAARLESPTVQRSATEAPARPPLPTAGEQSSVQPLPTPADVHVELPLPSAPIDYPPEKSESPEFLAADRPDPAPRASSVTEPDVVQRVTLPVAHPAPQPAAAPQHSSATRFPAPPVIQRSTAAGRRLVVLPPVRRSSDVQRNADPAPAREHSDVFHSPRPVGLQRMFGTSPDRFERAPTVTAHGGRQSGDAPSHEKHFSTAPPDGPSYDATTNTITFAPPSVQRETTESAPEPAPVVDPEPLSTAAPAAAPTLTAAPALGAPAAAAPDVDELVNRLYDPLAARLRAELWLDRERAGVLMDLGR
ncbi:hypothetical protein [Mycolicibacterium wolinskyi]|uniref:hypothetical protein n=1 Tax=Mycolicibacterium wolinskyi TaxID=59750 RepID=UPI003917A7A7